MSEVKRYDLVYSEHMGAGIGMKPSGNYVTHDDYAALQQKLDAVLAENVKLKRFCKTAAFDADYEAELGMDRGGFTDALNDIKTPATDAFLSEVRAEAKLGVLSDLAGDLDARMKNRNTTPRRKSFLGFAWAAVETKRAELSNSLRADSTEGGV